ncbi:MAG: orotidine-5'-phosphate decarboxylase [Candidatus Aminicenantes bacterium]|nr:MAG: orotidine-5'-phosphate decarboxylase [Candidatus Aminicenantes bacterium]
MNMKEKIIVALDFDRYYDAKKVVDQLEEAVFFKIGLQAFLKFGEEIITYLKVRKKKLFLDLKFKDIPHTVYGAVQSSLKYLPDFLTLHLSGGAEMIKKAVEAAKTEPNLTLLGVTVLTSLSNKDLKETGVLLSAEEAVLKLCELGIKNGLQAFVCSPLEIQPIRKRFGNDVILVTPGIRPQWSARGDQKRVFTPKMAVDAGSNFLVIGRPITEAENPSQAFQKILEEITG